MKVDMRTKFGQNWKELPKDSVGGECWSLIYAPLRVSGIRNPNIKYKRVCCLPAFIVMIAFWIAFLISTSIMRLYSGQLTKLLGHGGLLSLFVIMSSIMFLSFFGSLPSLLRIFKGLLMNPITPVKTALTSFLQTNNDIDKEFFNTKSIGKINETVLYSSSTSFKDLAITAEEQRACKADLFIKSEFAKICNLSVTFDRFNNTQQTRFILCLDASSTIQKDLLAKLIYQIHNLLLSVMSAPVSIVLEANFKNIECKCKHKDVSSFIKTYDVSSRSYGFPLDLFSIFPSSS
ncbi:unnamed protein product [Schistosoma margrebowiei]|uniref:Uncharacterized protein n=1 Tax=Schistosoma margrebowiei TaxID=48269 RepID=A0A183M563_9TREM|nr:unnamed protein product [Schistosoma margrebowiei]